MKIDDEFVKDLENTIGSIYEVDRTSIIIQTLRLYIDLIQKWNKTHNIISRNSENILENVCDSVSVVKFFKEYFYGTLAVEKVVDIGSGNGFPGVPLSIIFSDLNFTLIDSNRKKCSFLRLVKAEFKLNNISVLNREFNESFNESFAISKAAFSPAYSDRLMSGLKTGGKVIIWATPNTREDFIKAMHKVSSRLFREQCFTLPSGKERLFLMFEKV